MRSWRVLIGDAASALKQLEDESVHAVITSPPFWALRDYGVEGQLGLERTPEEFVAKLVGVFGEVHRVLRKDGTAWVNMGDTYAGGGRGPQGKLVTLFGSATHMAESRKAMKARGDAARRPPAGYKAKDLIGVPWMFAFAMRAAGWYLRSDIIREKTNPTPEPVYDRPSRSHEYIFQFAKARHYFYDDVAVMDPVSGTAHHRGAGGYGSPKRSRSGELLEDKSSGIKNNASFSEAVRERVLYRSRRSVWTAPTAPSTEDHFATYPESLVEPCLFAATSERGVCAECGSPLERQVDRKRIITRPFPHRAEGEGDGIRGGYLAPAEGTKYSPDKSTGPRRMRAVKTHRNVRTKALTTGWEPSCDCCEGYVLPATVLDPFAGTGTTGVVALKHGRSFVGVELNPAYAQIARRRLGQVDPLLAREISGQST